MVSRRAKCNSNESRTLPNEEKSFPTLVKKLRELQCELIVLEATGGLEIPLTSALAAEGLPVVVMNPRQVRDFAKATWKLAKTDRIDALVLACFGETLRPERKPLKDEQNRDLEALVARRRQLVDMLTMEKKRLADVDTDLKKFIQST